MSLFKKRAQQRADNAAGQSTVKPAVHPKGKAPEGVIETGASVAAKPATQFASEPENTFAAKKSGQPSWDSWYAKFKQVASAGNQRLQLRGSDENIIDLMDHQPLRNAYKLGLDADQLGEQFAKDFDVGAFLRDNGVFK